MFEAQTFEKLLKEVLDNAPAGVDTRQGAIFYDAIAGITLKIAKLYTDLDSVFKLVFIDSATGEYLDKKALEYSIERNAATHATYAITFTGVTPQVGERFFADSFYFTLETDDNNTLYLKAEETGTAPNAILAGTLAIPVNNIQGLQSATFGEILEYGANAESDDSLRTRLQNKLRGTPLNGNKLHYKTWCEEVDGVGLAKIYPLWNSPLGYRPNTVKAVLFTPDGLPVGETLRKRVQNYVDSSVYGSIVGADGLTFEVSGGLGEGVANIGCHFTAFSPAETAINISFTAIPKSGSTVSSIKTEAQTAITAFLGNIMLGTKAVDDTGDITVYYNQILATLLSMTSVINITNLLVNSDTSDIVVTENYCAVLGTAEVTI
jgi:uncharacterized phage protein gp47/JayE